MSNNNENTILSRIQSLDALIQKISKVSQGFGSGYQYKSEHFTPCVNCQIKNKAIVELSITGLSELMKLRSLVENNNVMENSKTNAEINTKALSDLQTHVTNIEQRLQLLEKSDHKVI